MGETKTSWRVSAKGQKRKPAKKKPKAKAAEAVGGQTVQHAERLASSIELDEAEAGAPISMQTVSFIQQALDGMRRLNARAEYVTAHADELRAQAEATGRWLGTTEEERPLHMFFEPAERKGKEVPRFARIVDQDVIAQLEAIKARMYPNP
jgi:hypothetical protein